MAHFNDPLGIMLQPVRHRPRNRVEAIVGPSRLLMRLRLYWIDMSSTLAADRQVEHLKIVHFGQNSHREYAS